MAESRQAGSIIENAEQAAAAGNYASAEELLREAAALQEQTLGPHHPDLANTLNNLGVVCEMTDNPIDAEHYFRRAYTIASATLAPDHPFVLTSRKNFHDFCALRGRPTELRPSPWVAARLDVPVQRAAPSRESAAAAKKHGATPMPRKISLRHLVLGTLGGGALLIVILVMARPWRGKAAETKSPSATAMASANEASTASPTPQPAEPTAVRPPTLKPPATRSDDVDAVRAKPNTPKESSAMPTVITAQLCTALRAWRCDAVDSQVPPGPILFYTQVKSASDTTIEHRWYQGDRLRQAVQLPIQANPGAGYRTYSRFIISNERVGEWRVEVRSADGAVLREVRFTAR